MSVAPPRSEILTVVRSLYEERFPVKESGVFREADWRRVARAHELIHGPRVLEVGVGPGQLFNMLARDTSLESPTGIDVRWNKKLIRPERGALELMNICDLTFADGAFDCIVCMEVLEHLEVIEFPKALAELRRVAGKTLIMTVPFEEPLPVWHHDRPGGHRQSFSQEKIDRFFPHAERELLARGSGKWSWIMLTERSQP